MKTIRQNVFETNSSSTHVLAVVKNNAYKLPKSITFYTDEFGWEYKTHYDTQSKANYLYTVIEYVDKGKELEWLNKLQDILTRHGVECKFGSDDDGYVDHGYEAFEFVEDILNNEEKLLRFLFDERSYISTGNDNSSGYYIPGIGSQDSYYDENYSCAEWDKKVSELEKDYDFYYKGN